MAGKRRDDVREEDVTGLKYFDKLAPLLARLHEVGCQRDKAGNRTLHYDQYCMLVLLFLFNPVVRSLRAIQQASQLRKVQRKLGCLRASLGSLSEAKEVFAPERLGRKKPEKGDAALFYCLGTLYAITLNHRWRRLPVVWRPSPESPRGNIAKSGRTKE